MFPILIDIEMKILDIVYHRNRRYTHAYIRIQNMFLNILAHKDNKKLLYFVQTR